jgi:hypothetical protein
MILLITDRNGIRETVTNVDRITNVGLSGSRCAIQITRKDGFEAGSIELHDARVELLPDDDDQR